MQLPFLYFLYYSDFRNLAIDRKCLHILPNLRIIYDKEPKKTIYH
jgi:hypothetical protein